VKLVFPYMKTQNCFWLLPNDEKIK